MSLAMRGALMLVPALAGSSGGDVDSKRDALEPLAALLSRSDVADAFEPDE